VNTKKDQTYRTLTGKALDLGRLATSERQYLAAVVEKYRASPEWTRFASWWMTEIARHGLGRDSAAYRICQDLEGRLGIFQGKAALPDYRDYLEVLIEEQYGSRNKFCGETGIDENQLSRIFEGQGDFSVATLEKVLRPLHATLVVKSDEDLKASASPEEACRMLETALQ
jgi:hypothetical protein